MALRIPIASPITPAWRRLLGVGGALALALPVAACTFFEQEFEWDFARVRPPSLELTTPAPTRDPRARDPSAPVTLRNGAGEVLLSGVPDAQGRIGGNPPPEKLDGTLVLEQRRNDGSTRTDRFTHRAGDPVVIRRDPATDAYSVAAPPRVIAHPQAFVDFTYGGYNRPNVTRLGLENGVNLTGTAFDQDNASAGFEWKAGFSVPLQRDSWLAQSVLGRPLLARLNLFGSYGYAEANDSQDRLGANGQIFRIYTPGNGFATGQDLADLRYNSEYREIAAGATLRKIYGGETLQDRRFFFMTDFGFKGGKQYVDETLSFRSTSSNTQFDERQKTDSTFIGMPIGGGVYIPLHDQYDDEEGPPPLSARALHLYIEGLVEPRYNSGDTRWSVRTTGFADRNADLSKNAFTVGSELRVGLRFGDLLGVNGVANASPISADIGATAGVKSFPTVEYTDLNRGDGGAKLDYRYGTYFGARVGIQYRF